MIYRFDIYIRAVLGNLDLLDNLTKGGTVSSSVLSADTDLLSSLTLHTGYIHCHLAMVHPTNSPLSRAIEYSANFHFIP